MNNDYITLMNIFYSAVVSNIGFTVLYKIILRNDIKQGNNLYNNTRGVFHKDPK